MMKHTMQKSISLYQPWSYLLSIQFLLAMSLINKNIGAVSANAVTPEIPTVSDNENEFNDILMSNDGPYEEKRNWQSLQGSWGKRSQNDNDFNADMMIDNEQMLPVLVATNMEGKPKMQLALLTNPRVLEHYTNQHRVLTSLENNDMDDDNIFNEKRGWKKMSTAWGKRRNAGQSWNRGSWGKREPNWNNLKGMWGKRANGWMKLNNSWGKRSQQYTESN